MHQDEVDVLVVGAGFAGLSAAKSYLQCDPRANLLVVDNVSLVMSLLQWLHTSYQLSLSLVDGISDPLQGQSLGGTWAKERLYPGLRSNNLLGSKSEGCR